MKFFPLTHLPERKFNLGDRVQIVIRFPDTNKEYLVKGTVFGYQYQHELWAKAPQSEVLTSECGWVYAVTQNYEELETGIDTTLCIAHYHESRLEKIQGLEYSEIPLLSTALEDPLADVLRDCFIVITANEIHIQCDKRTAARIQKSEYLIRKMLSQKQLPTNIKIQASGENFSLQHDLIVNVYQTFPIKVFMSENQEIIKRVQRHKALLEAISKTSVAVTIHDVNEAECFLYLDVLVDFPERLNKSRDELIGHPASIVDPQISEPRIHHIKRALAYGQCETYSYTYDDPKHKCTWEFDVSIAPLYGTEEIITIVEDAQSWQKDYWVNKLNLNK